MPIDSRKLITENTDKYFTKTKDIILNNGDNEVVYAIFLRADSLLILNPLVDFLTNICKQCNYQIKLFSKFQVGDVVPKLEPLCFLQGKFSELVELETLILQKIGFISTTAWHAYQMCKHVPYANFISMLARHCLNANMVFLADYAISIGSQKAINEGCKGFIGSSTDLTSKMFNKKEGLGTMPHALIGYAGSTLQAAKLYYEQFPNHPLTILVDYYAQEITDALNVCQYFNTKNTELALRLDTHGGRYMEGLDYKKSIQVIDNYLKEHNLSHLKSAFNEQDHKYLYGKGVSIAALIYLKQQLLQHNFDKVKIVASSGFNLRKCELVGLLNVPLDTIGTGCAIPDQFNQTYATADIISYNGKFTVKQGREFLIHAFQQLTNQQSGIKYVIN